MCGQEEITVLAGTDLASVSSHLKQTFETSGNYRLKLVTASLEELPPQTDEGLAIDLIISSDINKARNLHDSGQCQKNEIFALAQLAFWSKQPIKTNLSAFLTDGDFQRLVLIAPSASVTGKNSQIWLEENGYWPLVRQKVLYLENMDSIFQQIRSGTADVVITGNSAIRTGNLQHIGHWMFLPNKLLPQSVCITVHGLKRNKKASTAFYDFLFSHEARSILQGRGYLLPPRD